MFFVSFQLLFFFLSFNLSAQASATLTIDSNGIVKCTSGCTALNTGAIGPDIYTIHDNTSLGAKPISDTDWNRVVTTLVTRRWVYLVLKQVLIKILVLGI